MVVIWLAVQISVEWEEESIFLRLGPEMWRAVDRTTYLPRRTTPAGFATPLIALFQFPYDNEKLLRKQDESDSLCGGAWKQRPLSTRIYKYSCFFNQLQANTNVEFVGDGTFDLD